MQTAERVSSFDPSDNVIYQRHLVAYNEAARHIGGDVLEIGCGEGYGISLLADKVDDYVAIDKFQTELKGVPDNVSFYQMIIPPLKFQDDRFDHIVSFQVIEHIEDDEGYVRESHRVLKKGGKMIITTPNIKMSLTRNPWHVREYTVEELRSLMAKYFSKVEMYGVFGNQKVMDYYEKNKESVAKITKFDVLNLQYRLPRQLLQIPYDILNRVNRRRLMKGNNQLVSDIQLEDYMVKEANDQCFDLLVVAEK